MYDFSMKESDIYVKIIYFIILFYAILLKRKEVPLHFQGVSIQHNERNIYLNLEE